jgi:hypothetical protein
MSHGVCLSRLDNLILRVSWAHGGTGALTRLAIDVAVIVTGKLTRRPVQSLVQYVGLRISRRSMITSCA